MQITIVLDRPEEALRVLQAITNPLTVVQASPAETGSDGIGGGDAPSTAATEATATAKTAAPKVTRAKKPAEAAVSKQEPSGGDKVLNDELPENLQPEASTKKKAEETDLLGEQIITPHNITKEFTFKAATSYAKSYGGLKFKELLTKYNAKRFDELKPEDYFEFAKECGAI